jgi:hypothetical protein
MQVLQTLISLLMNKVHHLSTIIVAKTYHLMGNKAKLIFLLS